MTASNSEWKQKTQQEKHVGSTELEKKSKKTFADPMVKKSALLEQQKQHWTGSGDLEG